MALFAVNFAFSVEQPQMDVHIEDIHVGETAQVKITLPTDATGIVTVSLDGHDYNATLVGGKATVDLRGLNAGNYTLEVTYHGEGNNSDVTMKDVKFEVIDPNPTVDNNTTGNASGEPTNSTPINNTTPDNNTTDITPDNQTNASGEPVNNTTVVVNNVTNVTNNTENVNNTNITNNTTTNNNVVQQQRAPTHNPRQPPKPHNQNQGINTNAGLPILVVIIVVIGVAGGIIYKKR